MDPNNESNKRDVKLSESVSYPNIIDKREKHLSKPAKMDASADQATKSSEEGFHEPAQQYSKPSLGSDEVIARTMNTKGKPSDRLSTADEYYYGGRLSCHATGTEDSIPAASKGGHANFEGTQDTSALAAGSASEASGEDSIGDVSSDESEYDTALRHPAFVKRYPDLNKPYKIWDAYNLDECKLDMDDEVVCNAVSHAWEENCTPLPITGPPAETLRQAMAEKRGTRLTECTETTAWAHWRARRCNGAARTVSVVKWSKSPMELYGAGKLNPYSNSDEDLIPPSSARD